MDNKNFIINLEKHQTKDINDSHINGELTVIWRDWDKILPKNPEMVYVNTVNAKEIKGPHLHKNRTTYFYCISGEIVIIIEDSEGKIHEISANSNIPILIVVPNKLSAAIINPTNNISKVLVLADVAWKPNDNEMINVTFDNYDWEKWKNNDKKT
jgi:dTDP-4-dehydrorhamnose 3,5-epimerase